MNVFECMKILSDRQTASKTAETVVCPCCNMPNTCVLSSKPKKPYTAEDRQVQLSLENEVLGINNGSLGAMSLLQLTNYLISLQELRVKTYKEYDILLDELLEANDLSQYPILCNNMTERFSSLSETILKVKEEFITRNITSMSTMIVKIQQLEKEKLLLVAASHLDKMQAQLPTLQTISGEKDEVQRKYLREKIQETEQKIHEILEEIQMYKIELVENEEEAL